MKKEISYLQLFMLFFKINLVTFGGGYTIVPVVRQEFAIKRNLIDDDTMLNIIALAQTGPGAMALIWISGPTNCDQHLYFDRLQTERCSRSHLIVDGIGASLFNHHYGDFLFLPQFQRQFLGKVGSFGYERCNQCCFTSDYI